MIPLSEPPLSFRRLYDGGILVSPVSVKCKRDKQQGFTSRSQYPVNFPHCRHVVGNMFENMRTYNNIEHVRIERKIRQVRRLHIVDVPVSISIDIAPHIREKWLLGEPYVKAVIWSNVEKPYRLATYTAMTLQIQLHETSAIASVANRAPVVLAPHAANDLTPIQDIKSTSVGT